MGFRIRVKAPVPARWLKSPAPMPDDLPELHPWNLIVEGGKNKQIHTNIHIHTHIYTLIHRHTAHI